MDKLTQGLISGFIFATLDILPMISYKAKSPKKKTEAVLIVLIQRFATGFVIPFITLPMDHALSGAVVALVLSVPLALYLKMYPPLLGIIIGFAIGWFT